VPGVDAEAQLLGPGGGGGIGGEGLLVVAGGVGAGVAFGVQLDPVAADLPGGVDLG